MLQPKRTKYRKVFKGRNEALSWSATQVSVGEYGLKATATGRLTDRRYRITRNWPNGFRSAAIFEASPTTTRQRRAVWR